MRFFEMDDSLKEAVEDGSEAVIPLIEVEGDTGEWISLPDTAIIELKIRSYQDKPGCYCVSGEILFQDEDSLLSGLNGQNRSIRILFTVKSTQRSLHRFTLTPDQRGFVRYTSGGISYIYSTLEDSLQKLKKQHT